ncbi:hypothetical protein L7F22_062420 [Adiantum nelumboides]|nr:hypothetical protein [Adiantum nelumboides]
MPYTPQQNGVAERKNRSLMEMARCMLKAKSLPHKLWMEAVACAAHVLNKCPTRALKTITPYESWYDRKPSVSYLRVFGCLAYAHIPKQLRGKLDDKAVKCIFVGYSSGSKGYRLYNPATNKILESCDVISAETTAQPMVAFNVPHMQTQDVFEEEIVREEQEVLREEQTLPKWVQNTLQDSKLDASLPRKTRAAPAGKKVTCANNASYPIKGVGKILITVSDGLDLCLPDVLYVPGIKKNLLSVFSLAKNGLRVIFEDDRCIVRDRENGYSLITTETKIQAMQDAELWHARFGHVGYGSLMTLQRHNMVHDLSLLEMPPRHVCESCLLGKMHRFAFSQDGSVRVTQKLQLVHSDVCGPMRTPSVGNSLYFVTFIDDFSRFCWVYPLKAKSDVFAIFQHYVSMVENETGCKV